MTPIILASYHQHPESCLVNIGSTAYYVGYAESKLGRTKRTFAAFFVQPGTRVPIQRDQIPLAKIMVWRLHTSFFG
jgi:hypothetical protein